MEEPILDSTVIKDLSNHIYEKRKATAFQIENLTKVALARNDSQTIYKVISELTKLTNSSSSSTRMGAITALGSVSVALGSFAIAYFLDDIMTPIFATFRDTDARIRYYACESLYNIAKIARGEILRYFNEVFDILCVLVTDAESSVKNAADILDRLIKDIVSAKATNYVSILKFQDQGSLDGSNGSNEIRSHYISSSGDAYQVNEPQDAQKAFSLPKFIPTLLERMYTIDPFTKKFLISWLELLDDLPALELITFLPNFLDPLLKFFLNSAPPDVRLETQNLLNIFLKEIRAIDRVKVEARKKRLQDELLKLRAEDSSQEKEQEKVTNMNAKAKTKEPTSGTEEDRITNDDHGADSDKDNVSVFSSETTVIRAKDNDSSNEKNDSKEDLEYLDGQNIFIDFSKVTSILLSFLRLPPSSSNNSSSEYEINFAENEDHDVYLEVEFTTLKWLEEILKISPTSFIKFLPDCISVVLKNISYTDENDDKDLRNEFLSFNSSLQSILESLKMSRTTRKLEEKPSNIKSKTIEDQEPKSISLKLLEEYEDKDGSINERLLKGLNSEVYEEFIETNLTKTLRAILSEYMNSTNEMAKIALLDWLTFLYSFNIEGFFASFSNESEESLFNITLFLESSIEASNDVVLKILQLFAEILTSDENFFREFILQFVTFCEMQMGPVATISDKAPKSRLTTKRVSFIVRKLCLLLSSERIYKALSEILTQMDSQNMEFQSKIIVTFNHILLTSTELTEFRTKLKNIDISKSEDWNLFSALFECWCYNPVSAISLCLLTSNYELAYLIIKSLSEIDVNYDLFAQLDILIQLIESPIFLRLRLQLLEPEKNPYLNKCLYGILMILPQSSTYNTLKNRLSAIGSGCLCGMLASTSVTPGNTPAPSSNLLSIKKKKTIELLDKFTRAQEKHNTYEKIKNRQKVAVK